MIQLVHFPAEEDKLGLLLSVQLAFQSFVVVGLLIILDIVIVLTDIVLGPSGLFSLVGRIIIGLLRLRLKLCLRCLNLDLVQIALMVYQHPVGGF